MMREELIFKGDEIMNYQELVNKCKKAYKDNILGLSYKYWCDIHDILDKKLKHLTTLRLQYPRMDHCFDFLLV